MCVHVHSIYQSLAVMSSSSLRIVGSYISHGYKSSLVRRALQYICANSVNRNMPSEKKCQSNPRRLDEFFMRHSNICNGSTGVGLTWDIGNSSFALICQENDVCVRREGTSTRHCCNLAHLIVSDKETTIRVYVPNGTLGPLRVATRKKRISMK